VDEHFPNLTFFKFNPVNDLPLGLRFWWGKSKKKKKNPFIELPISISNSWKMFQTVLMSMINSAVDIVMSRWRSPPFGAVTGA